MNHRAARRLTGWTTLLCLCLLANLAVPELVLAESYGGIEIGAKGIRAVIVDVPAGDKESQLLMVENKNTTLVADLATTKRYSPKSLAETADIVGNLAKKMRQQFKLPNGRLYVVGSSGIFVGLNNAADIQANKTVLTDAIRNGTGLTMDFVTVEREAELTIVSVVPSAHRHDAVLLDIGSGNTKGGAVKKDGGLMTFSLPFGTVSFTDRVKKEAEGRPFAKVAAERRDQLLIPHLRKTLENKGELVERKRVYLGGGSVWALTTLIKPLNREPFVPLSPLEFERFRKALLENDGKLPTPDLSGASDAARKKAEKDLDKVRQTFSSEQLAGGMEILNALVVSFHLDHKDKQIYFARNMYVGWILGYTIEKGTADR